MITAAAIALTVILAALAVFQAALIAGAPLGHFAWGGQEKVLSRGKRIGSVISIALYAAFAMVALQRAGLIEVFPSTAFVEVAMWVIAAYSALGIVMNGISRSKHERYTMAPLSLVLAALSFVIAAS